MIVILFIHYSFNKKSCADNSAEIYKKILAIKSSATAMKKTEQQSDAQAQIKVVHMRPVQTLRSYRTYTLTQSVSTLTCFMA